MFAECKEYLIGKLKTAGIQSTPYTSMKKLKLSRESHIGAVLFETDEFTRNGSKRIYKDEAAAQHKRRKVFDRSLTFTVIIGDYEQDKTEVIFENFLTSLDKGLYIDGNYTPLEVVDADWVDKDDSILASKVAVQVKLRFDGGVYKDTDFAHLSDIAIESIEKENQNGG